MVGKNDHGGVGAWVPRMVALGGSLAFLFFGAWALLQPSSFFDTVAHFEPYNQHFLQDIGAFQIGLGAVLLLAALVPDADALTVALLGSAVGALFHAASHIIGINLGGNPAADIPTFAVLAIVLLVAGVLRWRSS